MAMASSAMEMRSPAVSRMSSSRAAGWLVIASARSRSSSVVSPMAETTTTTSLPSSLVLTTRLATRWMLAASATDDPPNFCTTRAMNLRKVVGNGHQVVSRRPRTSSSLKVFGPEPVWEGQDYDTQHSSPLTLGRRSLDRYERRVGRPQAPYGRLGFEPAASLEGAPEGDLVGVFQVAAHGQARGEPGDRHAHAAQHSGEVGGGGLPLDVGISGEDDLGDGAVGQAG